MEKLIKRRAVIKGSISRIETFVSKHDNAANMDVHEFSIRDTVLQQLYSEYKEVQSNIEDLDSEKENDREEVEMKYFSLLSKIKSLVKSLSVEPANVQVPVQQHSFPPVEVQNHSVKLPNLSIPTFSGHYEDWNSFFDIFCALIHSDTKLSDVQKFLYLKTSLKGEPLNLIEDLQVTNENYSSAFQIVKDRYSNKLSIINSHLKSLLELPQLTKLNNVALREFVTKIKKHVNALNALKVPTESWDIILVYVFSHKLDSETHKAYEFENKGLELPTLKVFLDFLEQRSLALERVAATAEKPRSTKMLSHVTNSTISETNTQRQNCLFCKFSNHSIYKCFKFVKLPVSERKSFVTKNKLCYNCLGSKHQLSQCLSRKCSICNGKHHSLIHEYRIPHLDPKEIPDKVTERQSVPVPHIQEVDGSDSNSNVHNHISALCERGSPLFPSTTVLLSTAKVVLVSENGNKLVCRALLDSCSMHSFINSQVFNKLKTPYFKGALEISGIGQNKTQVDKQCNLYIQSLVEKEFLVKAKFAVLDDITGYLPQIKLDRSRLNMMPPDIQLGDPEFYHPAQVDVLIGADLYYDIIKPGLIKLGHNLPTLQNTRLGWVIGGPMMTNQDSIVSHTHLSRSLDLNEIIPKFWQLEEVQSKRILSPQDKACESVFTETTNRLTSGRFQVNLPLKTPDEDLKLGDSYKLALQRFLSLERRLHRNPYLYSEYKRFIDEYVHLGHARYVPLNLSNSSLRKNFLPHHCVLKNESTTKLRVVFDGSMKTTSGVSLNDVLLKGFPVQPDLFDILCRFRCFMYVLLTDIQKMYRQVRVNPSQNHLQNILWRNSTNERVKCIELQTVTYGINCAPYLATRCLVELAKSNSLEYPLASQALLEQCYVDDVLAGSHSLKGVTQLYKELSSLLSSAGFTLHKWYTNDPSILQFIPNTHSEKAPLDVSLIESSNSTKVLGLYWNPSKDCFKMSFSHGFVVDIATKRSVLSNIGSMFDPLGLVGPVVLAAKILMQKIWCSKINWDELLPPDLLAAWKLLTNQLSNCTELESPRCLIVDANFDEVQLIGFSDASQVAYGACLYLRVKYSNYDISSRLICSKSRVAPLKTISLPRLELCAALLLARLVNKIVKVFRMSFHKIHLYTDSEIVLHWLKATPSRWTTFVANRVSEIQELTVNCTWSHVSSKENPADYISRSCDPNHLKENSLWWNGPSFLLNENYSQKTFLHHESNLQSVPEERKVVAHLRCNSSFLFSRFSKFLKMTRIIAYCIRFFNNCNSHRIKITDSNLTVKELAFASQTIITCIQLDSFSKEISLLKSNKPLLKGDIKNLNPFIDKAGVLRVGGRIENAYVSFEQKHPILLPKNHHVVTLIIRHEHERLGHAGAQSVLCNLRLKYWPVNALNQIKKVIKDCVICHRLKASFSQQLMGSLPTERVTPNRPFLNVGVDFAGPVSAKESKLRRARITKAYISLFVCMNTKAVHLELVSDLSTPNFILCLKRFIARRGVPNKIFSDNAKNFQGSCNSLHDVYKFFKGKEVSQVYDYLTTQQCQWSFIPPNSPHWGGLWEAGIKSMKYHLKRVIGNTVLTLEQLSTVLCQIEGILNSRPLIPTSNNIDDFSCLTPGHFLIGVPLTSLPEKDLSKIPDNRLHNYNLISKMRQHFWQRWHLEYLNRLQQRPKWMTEKTNLKPKLMVILKEDNVSPMHWPLGRITEVLVGPDKRVRVVKVQTSKGIFMRPITKISPLPFELVEDEKLQRGGGC